jgi:50S ribosomal protein L16 3-hydroxylase
MLDLDININIREFVQQYWQKKPCLLRNALPNFESVISPEELAGLACEEDVHCRLVLEGSDNKPWVVRYGPFEEQDFLDLPESNYSLLVSECEKWVPEFNDLLDQFRFIPDWRIDDLMISYAPEGGSVGPHVDQYDVFLLQALGTRRWQYCETPSQDDPVIDGLELAILQDFKPQQDVVLNPGDILYLPPGYAHHGVALERCMTYSIGFRAPNAASVLESFALESERLEMTSERYRDADLELERHHAEITDQEIERFRDMANRMLEQSPGLWRDAIGKLLSDSAVTTPDDNDLQPVYLSDLQASSWIRHPESRILYHRSANAIEVYYNGQVHELPQRPEILEQLQKLCENYEWSTELMHESIEIEALRDLLIELATNHAILPLVD